MYLAYWPDRRRTDNNDYCRPSVQQQQRPLSPGVRNFNKTRYRAYEVRNTRRISLTTDDKKCKKGRLRLSRQLRECHALILDNFNRYCSLFTLELTYSQILKWNHRVISSFGMHLFIFFVVCNNKETLQVVRNNYLICMNLAVGSFTSSLKK